MSEISLLKLKWFDFCLLEDINWGDWMEDNNFPGNITYIKVPIISLTD